MVAKDGSEELVRVVNPTGPVIFTGVVVCLGPDCFGVPPSDPSFVQDTIDRDIAECLRDEDAGIIPSEQVRAQVVNNAVLVTLLDASGPKSISSSKLSQDLMLQVLNPHSNLRTREIGMPRASEDRDLAASSRATPLKGEVGQLPLGKKNKDSSNWVQVKVDLFTRLKSCMTESQMLTEEIGRELRDLRHVPAMLAGAKPNETASLHSVPEAKAVRASNDPMDQKLDELREMSVKNSKERSAIIARLEGALEHSRKSISRSPPATPANFTSAGMSSRFTFSGGNFEGINDQTPIQNLWDERSAISGVASWRHPQTTPENWMHVSGAQSERGATNRRFTSPEDVNREILTARLPYRREWEESVNGSINGDSESQMNASGHWLHSSSLEGKHSLGGEGSDALRKVDERVSRLLDTLDKSGSRHQSADVSRVDWRSLNSTRVL